MSWNGQTSFTEKNTASRGQRRRIFSEEICTSELLTDGRAALRALSSKFKQDQTDESKKVKVKDSDVIRAADAFLRHTLLVMKDGYEYQENELEQLLEKHEFSVEETALFQDQFRILSVILMRDIASKIVSQRDPVGSNMVEE